MIPAPEGFCERDKIFAKFVSAKSDRNFHSCFLKQTGNGIYVVVVVVVILIVLLGLSSSLPSSIVLCIRIRSSSSYYCCSHRRCHLHWQCCQCVVVVIINCLRFRHRNYRRQLTTGSLLCVTTGRYDPKTKGKK